ncbi:MAG: YdiU family protein [Pseudomonadota bacterium]
MGELNVDEHSAANSVAPILELQDLLLTEVKAADFPATDLRFRNDKAAVDVGLDTLTEQQWVAHFGRFEPLPDNLPNPYAMAYHGHQFRTYNPDIGDGRGFLFAQLRDQTGRLMDLGTKGSGTTPYSRSGDGRLTLKGAFREILATEMLEALGVLTSRTLSVIETGEQLFRQDEPSPARSAVLVRLNHGHIRFGTFQRLMALGDDAGLRRLLSYAARTYFPAIDPDDASAFLGAVCERMATMTAQLMAAGFVHGVLNTDNMNITGECFDYGPWRFAPTGDPALTAAYFDYNGLYAFGRQPEAMYWNVAALAHALGPLADQQQLKDALERFPDLYAEAFGEAVFRRLGLEGGRTTAHKRMAGDLLAFIHEHELPFEQVLFDLFGGTAGAFKRERSPHADVYRGAAIVEAIDRETPVATERLSHDLFQGGAPQTMLIDEVEALWSSIAEKDDWQPFYEKIEAVRLYGEALNISVTP